MTLPLTKTLDPADVADLAEELVIVDRHFTAAREQHIARRWEYALALRAFKTWGGRAIHACVDVGGAGSPFWRMLPVDNVLVVDPTEGHDLAGYLATNPRPRLADGVFCLSVIEHVDDLDRFLYHLSCLVAPGGLLFLTMDCWDRSGPDAAHFHWDRKRIFYAGPPQAIPEETDWQAVVERFLDWEFSLLGTADWTYHGHQLYNSYSFASLALVKRS